MRTTLSLDDDVAALLEQMRKARDTTFKQVVNDALREGLARLSAPAETQAFRTQPVDLGSCHYPNLDNVWEILDDVERSGTGR
jgi:Ribbon-helix-helix protein, copG family